VPLQAENRVIVYNGIKEVLSKRLVPFTTLRSHIWIDDESTLTEVLAKTIPIVGASRSHEGGNLGCELLLCTEEDDAEEYLTDLVMDCERKREKARRVLDRVMEHLPSDSAGPAKGLVLVEEHLPNKTVGFCTARIAEVLHKPVIIVSLKDDKGIGEARGPKGFDLVAALAAHSDYFLGFGGHKQAAGFSIERSKVADFRAEFADYLEEHVDPSVIRREITIDGVLTPKDMDLASIRSLLCLEPFGEGNQRPVFLLESFDGRMVKEIEGSFRLGDVALTGERFVREKPWQSPYKMEVVVSPFADGSIRMLEVIDWKNTK
jgi:single-stranded-DNA-specific exonuclease